MALVMMCGFPSAGKTRRAGEIAAFFREHRFDVQVGLTVCPFLRRQTAHQRNKNKNQIVDDAMVGVDRTVTYSSAAGEKLARGGIKASVERYLNKTTVVGCVVWL
jgi:protein KTI12